MANTRIKNIDKFSFPTIITECSDYQFEFDCVKKITPTSANSPADHLFFNGKLLPHVFPVQEKNIFSYSRSTSRTSSKDSMFSSRSNSMNSRNSNCSSARTSTSSERNIPSRLFVKERNRPLGLNLQYDHQYQSCKRWQFIAAAPVLKQRGLRSTKVEKSDLDRKGLKKSDGLKSSWFGGRRILKSFVSSCKECHAIKTSNGESVLQTSLEL